MSNKVVVELLRSDYEGFIRLVDGVKNMVDAYIEINGVLDDVLDEGVIDCKKKGVDASIKSFKLAGEKLRESLLLFQNKGVKNLCIKRESGVVKKTRGRSLSL